MDAPICWRRASSAPRSWAALSGARCVAPLPRSIVPTPAVLRLAMQRGRGLRDGLCHLPGLGDGLLNARAPTGLPRGGEAFLPKLCLQRGEAAIADGPVSRKQGRAEGGGDPLRGAKESRACRSVPR